MILCDIWCFEQLVRYVNCCNIFLCDAWNLCTYRFWALGEKTPFLLSMLRKERCPFYGQSDTIVFLKVCFMPQHTHLTKYCQKFTSCPILLPLMQYDVWCNVVRNDAMIWWWRQTHTHTHAHTETHKTLHPLRNEFWVFKLCIPLGMTLSFFTFYFDGI